MKTNLISQAVEGRVAGSSRLNNKNIYLKFSGGNETRSAALVSDKVIKPNRRGFEGKNDTLSNSSEKLLKLYVGLQTKYKRFDNKRIGSVLSQQSSHNERRDDSLDEVSKKTLVNKERDKEQEELLNKEKYSKNRQNQSSLEVLPLNFPKTYETTNQMRGDSVQFVHFGYFDAFPCTYSTVRFAMPSDHVFISQNKTSGNSLPIVTHSIKHFARPKIGPKKLLKIMAACSIFILVSLIIIIMFVKLNQ